VTDERYHYRFVLPPGYTARGGGPVDAPRYDRYFSNEDVEQPLELSPNGVFITVRVVPNPQEYSLSEWVTNHRTETSPACVVSEPRELTIAERPAEQITVVSDCLFRAAPITYVAEGDEVFSIWMAPMSLSAAEEQRPAYQQILGTFEIGE
jgi:hypothetical protein